MGVALISCSHYCSSLRSPWVHWTDSTMGTILTRVVLFGCVVLYVVTMTGSVHLSCAKKNGYCCSNLTALWRLLCCSWLLVTSLRTVHAKRFSCPHRRPRVIRRSSAVKVTATPHQKGEERWGKNANSPSLHPSLSSSWPDEQWRTQPPFLHSHLFQFVMLWSPPLREGASSGERWGEKLVSPLWL